MGLLELFILAVGLSMDAFAVSVCKGLSVTKMEPKHALLCGAYFGGFQALMPLIGYLLGSMFTDLITSVSHWIAFVLHRLCASRDHWIKHDQRIQGGRRGRGQREL